MPSLGLFMLGAYVGFVTVYGLRHITDWNSIAAILSAIVSAAVSGGLYAFLQLLPKLGVSSLDEAVFFYPVGLAFGALCIQLTWLTDPALDEGWKIAHAIVVGIGAILLLFVFFSPRFRNKLPGYPRSVDSPPSEPKR